MRLSAIALVAGLAVASPGLGLAASKGAQPDPGSLRIMAPAKAAAQALAIALGGAVEVRPVSEDNSLDGALILGAPNLGNHGLCRSQGVIIDFGSADENHNRLQADAPSRISVDARSYFYLAPTSGKPGAAAPVCNAPVGRQAIFPAEGEDAALEIVSEVQELVEAARTGKVAFDLDVDCGADPCTTAQAAMARIAAVDPRTITGARVDQDEEQARIITTIDLEGGSTTSHPVLIITQHNSGIVKVKLFTKHAEPVEMLDRWPQQ